MKVFISLVSLVLLVAFANAVELDELKTKFNNTVRGHCQQDATATTAAANAATTASTQKPAATPTSAPPTTAEITTTPATTTPTPTTTASAPISNSTSSHIKKRAAQLCGDEETKVSNAQDVADFNKLLKDYYTCQKDKCPNLNTVVEDLLKESGATAVKVCGLLLGLMFVISYFG